VGDEATIKSDVTRVAFEKALDGVGRAEVESRYRRAVFEKGEMETTLGIAQEVGTRLHNENVLLKNGLRAAKIMLERGDVDRATECIDFALSTQLYPEELSGNEDHR
jgi:hypothetical protein